MALNKPSWLVYLLDLWNIRKGEWIDVTIPIPFVSDIHLDVPPWNFPIGDIIEDAIDGVLGIIDAALGAIRAVMATTADIYQAGIGLAQNISEVIRATAADLLGRVNDVYGAITSGLAAVYEFINNGLAAARRETAELIVAAAGDVWDRVVDLVDSATGAALEAVREQINIVSTFGDEIQELFTDPENYILNKLESALDRFW